MVWKHLASNLLTSDKFYWKDIHLLVACQSKPYQKNQDDFIDYLLNGPIYTDKEIEVIEENRKSIAAWRTTS